MILFVCKQIVKVALIFGKQVRIKVLQSGKLNTVSILKSSPFSFNFENQVLSCFAGIISRRNIRKWSFPDYILADGLKDKDKKLLFQIR
jgi:hypothetical protein